MSKCLGHDISVRQHSKSEHELPATSRHRRDMTERLLKATLSPFQTNKQTKKIFIRLSNKRALLMVLNADHVTCISTWRSP